MSEHTPVCAKCFYRLGGWTSSVCPECGSDVRRVGVRTGPSCSRSSAHAAVVGLTLLLIAPLTFSFADWVFERRTDSQSASLASTAIENFEVKFVVEHVYQRFPPKDDVQIRAFLVYHTQPAPGETWYNGQYIPPATSRMTVLSWKAPSTVPSEQVILERLGTILPEAINTENRRRHAVAIRGLFESSAEGRLSVAKYHPMASFLDGDVIFSSGGSGTGFSREMNIAGLAFVPAVVLMCLISGLIAVNRRIRGGWRHPKTDEWQAMTSS